jgi:hypothetical protein
LPLGYKITEINIVYIVVFIAAVFEYGPLALFMLALALAVWFNFRFGDSESGVGLSDDEFQDLFASPPLTEA